MNIKSTFKVYRYTDWETLLHDLYDPLHVKIGWDIVNKKYMATHIVYNYFIGSFSTITHDGMVNDVEIPTTI